LKDEIVSLPEGSCIQVFASPVQNGERVSIIVRDNGPGLSEETHRNIFDPFNARSDSPSEHGINLMACFFLVRYHHGKIEVQNAEGKGAEFRMELPVGSNDPAQAVQSREFFQKLDTTDDLWQKLLVRR